MLYRLKCLEEIKKEALTEVWARAGRLVLARSS
jgi:hypothetical protein